jgi:hypothetical protein
MRRTGAVQGCRRQAGFPERSSANVVRSAGLGVIYMVSAARHSGPATTRGAPRVLATIPVFYKRHAEFDRRLANRMQLIQGRRERARQNQEALRNRKNEEQGKRTHERKLHRQDETR